MIEIEYKDEVIKIEPHMTIGQYQDFIQNEEVYKTTQPDYYHYI